MKQRAMLYVFLVLIPLAPFAIEASTPNNVWVVTLDGKTTIEDAWAAGVEVLDRAPGLLVIGDERSAATLALAGFAVEGPIATNGLSDLALLYPKGDPGLRVPDRDEMAERFGDLLLWSDGLNAIVHLNVVALFEADSAGLHVTSLRDSPVRPARPRAATGADREKAATFDPLIDGMVAQVDSARYMKWIGDLAGAQEIVVGGQPVTFWTRWSANAQCDTAEQFVYEQFQAMGYTDVRYDTFNVLSQQSRNVVATLPGTVSPDDIYIICGHLDSRAFNATLPAPGANDTASGTAVVMCAAEIMRQYEFESTIRFLAVTGEEQGLFGSSRYAARAAAAGDNIVGVINLDMVAWDVGTYSLDIQGGPAWEWLMLQMADACAEYTGLGTSLIYSSSGSDHVSFQNEGFAAILGIEDDYFAYGCYHRSCDNVGQNDWQMGTDVTRATIAAIADLAGVAGVVTSVAAGPALPVSFLLEQPRPNPFNPSTTIGFRLYRPSAIELAVYDARGRLVQTLLREEERGTGTDRVTWNGEDHEGRPAASGVYFCKMIAGDEQEVRRLILIR